MYSYNEVERGGGGGALTPRANLHGNTLVSPCFDRLAHVLDTNARSALALRKRISRAFRVRRGRLRRRYSSITLCFDLGLQRRAVVGLSMLDESIRKRLAIGAVQQLGDPPGCVGKS